MRYSRQRKRKKSKRRSEAALYEPVLASLSEIFKPHGEFYLEPTARTKLSDNLKSVLSDQILFVHLVERFIPDLMGYIKRQGLQEIIVVEVKAGNLRLKDIFQVREYAEIFDATYAILVSPRPLSEEIRRILNQRPIHAYRSGYGSICVGCFDSSTNTITDWYPRPLQFGS